MYYEITEDNVALTIERSGEQVTEEGNTYEFTIEEETEDGGSEVLDGGSNEYLGSDIETIEAMRETCEEEYIYLFDKLIASIKTGEQNKMTVDLVIGILYEFLDDGENVTDMQNISESESKERGVIMTFDDGTKFKVTIEQIK